MSLYDYKAKDKTGKIVKGSVEAVNKDIAADMLGERDLIIIDIFRENRVRIFDKTWNFLVNRIKTRDIVLFMHELSVLISSEIPIVQSLRVLEKQTNHKYFKKVFLEIADGVEGGGKLSDAFSRYPKIFNNFFVKMIKSGETSGRLEEVFLFLADEQEKNYILARKIRSAMIYPIFIIITMIVIGIIMLVFVVPKIALMFEGAGAELPFSTRLLLGTSDFIVSSWWFFIIILAFLGYLFNMYKNTYAGRKIIDILVLKIPIFGSLLKRFYLTRFSRSFYTLVLGGVDIKSALKSSKDILNNIVYKELLEETIKEVEDGRSIAYVFSRSALIPPMYSQMISVGEKTGKLTSILEKITDFYTTEIEEAIKNSIALFGPVIMIVIGVTVGFLVASVIMPMYVLSSAF